MAAGTGGAHVAPAYCTEFTACGGDVVGTWKADVGCTPAKLSQPANPCPGETFDVTSVVPTITWTFRADLTLTATLSVAGPVKVQTTDECLAMRGSKPVACDDANAGVLYASQIVYPGGKVGSSTCQARANGTCACTITFVAAPSPLSGTYSTAGSVFTWQHGPNVSASDYCVEGTTLKIASGMAGQAPSSVGVYQKQ